jgi:hypothetical protein
MYSKKEGELMLKRTLLVVLLVFPVILAPVLVNAAPMISVGQYTVPSDQTPFLVPVQITDAMELVGWSFGLTYDPTDLLINTACDPFTDPYCDLITGPVTEGDFFSSGAPFNLLIPGFIALDSTTFEQIGELVGVEGLYGGFPPGPSGDGILAYVEFVRTETGNGDSTITVNDTSITSSAPVPEPATLVLLAGGLVFLGVLRLTRKKDRNVC